MEGSTPGLLNNESKGATPVKKSNFNARAILEREKKITPEKEQQRPQEVTKDSKSEHAQIKVIEEVKAEKNGKEIVPWAEGTAKKMTHALPKGQASSQQKPDLPMINTCVQSKNSQNESKVEDVFL